MAKYRIAALYYCTVETDVDLKNGAQWKDVEEWAIVHGMLNYRLKGSKEWVMEDLMDGSEELDIERPYEVNVYGIDEDGLVDYSALFDWARN